MSYPTHPPTEEPNMLVLFLSLKRVSTVTCSLLFFPSKKKKAADDVLGRGNSVRGARGRGSMRFIQLYTSPSFRSQRSKLVKPSDDWEQSERDVSKHKFSPLVSLGIVL